MKPWRHCTGAVLTAVGGGLIGIGGCQKNRMTTIDVVFAKLCDARCLTDTVDANYEDRSRADRLIRLRGLVTEQPKKFVS